MDKNKTNRNAYLKEEGFKATKNDTRAPQPGWIHANVNSNQAQRNTTKYVKKQRN